MDELMLLYTMDVLKSDGTTSVMLLLLHAVDHLTKTLMTLQMTIVEQYSYCHFHYWDPLLGHDTNKINIPYISGYNKYLRKGSYLGIDYAMFHPVKK